MNEDDGRRSNDGDSNPGGSPPEVFSQNEIDFLADLMFDGGAHTPSITRGDLDDTDKFQRPGTD